MTWPLPSLRKIAAIIAVPLAFLLTTAQAPQGSGSSQSPTAAADNLITDRTSGVAEQLSSSVDLLSKLKARAAALSQGSGGGPNVPGVAGGTFTQTIAKPPPSPEAAQALDTSSIQLQAAASNFAAAAKINEQAKSFEQSSPAYAQSLRKQALEKLDSAQGWVEKAEGNLVAADRLSGANLLGSRQTLRQRALPPPEVICNSACRQLKEIARRDEAGGPQLYLFDDGNAPRPDADIRPTDDRIFRGTFNSNSPPPVAMPSDPAIRNVPPRPTTPLPPTVRRENGRETLALSDRVILDLAPLHASVDAVVPSMRGKALLGACDDRRR
jgi:hypothetical protein